MGLLLNGRGMGWEKAMSNTCEWSVGDRVRVEGSDWSFDGAEMTITRPKDGDGDYMARRDGDDQDWYVNESHVVSIGEVAEAQQANRDDSNKPCLEAMLQFPKAMAMVTALMEAGARKYGQDNWKLGGKPDSEYINAALRHMSKHVAGEVLDEESGQPHLAHSAWNMLACCELNLGKGDG